VVLWGKGRVVVGRVVRTCGCDEEMTRCFCINLDLLALVLVHHKEPKGPLWSLRFG